MTDIHARFKERFPNWNSGKVLAFIEEVVAEVESRNGREFKEGVQIAHRDGRQTERAALIEKVENVILSSSDDIRKLGLLDILTWLRWEEKMEKITRDFVESAKRIMPRPESPKETECWAACVLKQLPDCPACRKKAECCQKCWVHADSLRFRCNKSCPCHNRKEV